MPFFKTYDKQLVAETAETESIQTTIVVLI